MPTNVTTTPDREEAEVYATRVASPSDRAVTVYSEYEHGPNDYGRLTAAVKRVSWGAIFAGAVVAVVLGFLLHLLGLGIGFTSFDPATQDDTVGGLGAMQGIWFVVSALIALFVGGWVAGRLAGMPRRTDGAIHGFVTWGITTIITLYFLASGVGTLVSGVTSVLGQGAQLAAQGVAAAAGPAVDQASQAAGGLDLGTIEQEVRALLRQTGDPALQPGNIEEQAQQAADVATAEAREADIAAAARRAFDQFGQITSEVDRQDLVNVIVARTDMSEAEARQAVGRWEQQFSSVREQVGQATDDLSTQAAQTAEGVTDAIGTAAIWSFFALLLGAVAASVGGLMGSPHDLPADAFRRPERPAPMA